jgi:hypothetical protein
MGRPKMLATCLLASFLLNLFLRPWRWRWYVPPKRRLTLNGLHGVISHKLILFKGKVVPVIIELSNMPWRRMGEWRYSATIIDLGTRWRWVVRFRPLPLYPQGKRPRYSLYWRLGGPQSRSGLESNPGLPAHSPDWDIPTPFRIKYCDVHAVGQQSTVETLVYNRC